MRRKSNFELLRIISMLFIILYHFMVYSESISVSVLSIPNFVYSFFRVGGKLGVVLFIMITGYFMIDSKTHLKKVLLLEGQVLFYSVLILIFVCLLGRGVSIHELVRSFFPNLTEIYWFFSSYFVLYLFIPYLNKFLLMLEQKDYQRILLFGFLFLILIPSLIIYRKPITEGIYLCYYYLVGAYIRLFYQGKVFKWRYFSSFCISYLMMVGISIFIKYLSCSNSILEEYVFAFSRISSIFVFSSAICLFLFFREIKITDHGIINRLGSVSFGVYLFHDHFLMRELLWRNLFCLSQLVRSPFFFLWGIVIAVGIYFVGGVLDWGRQVLFQYFLKDDIRYFDKH